MVQQLLKRVYRTSSDAVIRNHARGILVRLADKDVCGACEMEECMCEKVDKSMSR